MENKTRSEVEEKYKWDLSTIYKTETELLEEYKQTKQKIEKYKEKEQTFLDSPENLYEALKEYYDIEQILDKMWTYAFQKYDEDITNSHNQDLKEKTHTLYQQFSQNSSFLTPKILEFGYDNIEKYYQNKKQLKQEYEFILKNIFREKPHILSQSEEKLITSLNKAYSNTSKIATMLLNSDINFGKIIDEKGKEITLTETNYQIYISSENRSVRRNAFKTLYKSLEQFNNTFALLYAAEIDKKVTFSKIRKHKTSLESALFEENIDKKVYNNLIETVTKNLGNLHKYYKIKQNELKLEEMHLYDTYVDISKQQTKKYTFQEAKTLVIDSLQILGNEYIDIIKKAFDERWIDIYPNKGKRSGAYSAGSYLTNPYLLLNYNEKYNDISTLAHELGHSVHSYYSRKNNPIQYGYYQIFVAEVASQVNELLFNNYMLNKVKTKEEKINILNQILELFKASIYRQTMFAQFEKQITEANENGETLTATLINETYYKLVKQYFGPEIKIDTEIKYEWQRIPHFYYDFYVYKYSTGLAAACHIVKQITEDKNNIKKYLEFLKTGGSNYPLEELKIAGVDLTDPKVIQSGMDMFKQYLTELEKQLNN